MKTYRCILLIFFTVLLFVPSSYAIEGVWTYYTTENSGLVSNTLSMVVVDDNGVKWIGYRYGACITRFDGTSWRTYTTTDGLPDGIVGDIALHGNEVWAAIGGKLCKFDGEGWKVMFPESGSSFSRIAFDRSGNIWAAGTNWRDAPILSRYNGSVWTTWVFSWVDKIFTDSSNTIWFLTNGMSQRVYRFDGAKWERFSQEQIRNIYSITEDRNKVVWLTTENGAARFNGTSWDIFKDMGGPSMTIDRNNWKWFACYDFLLAYDDRTGSVERIDRPFSSNYSVDRIIADPDGSILLFGIWDETGLIRYTPVAEPCISKTARFESRPVKESTRTVAKSMGDQGGWLFPIHTGDTWIYRHSYQGGYDAPVYTGRFILTVIGSTASGDTLEFLDGRQYPIGYAAYYSGHPHFYFYHQNDFPEPSENGSSEGFHWNPVTITIPAGTYNGYQLSEQFLGGRFFSFIPGIGWAKSSLFTCLGEYENLDLEYALVDGREYSKETAVQAEPHPNAFQVYPPSPNPFNPSTTIRFEMNERSHVRLSIYTATGQKVADLCDRDLSSGPHSFIWKPERCAAGLYLYLLQAGKQLRTGKMMLIK
jgi:hypothetical protein